MHMEISNFKQCTELKLKRRAPKRNYVIMTTVIAFIGTIFIHLSYHSASVESFFSRGV